MLRSFRDSDTRAVWERRRSRKLDAVAQRSALRMLDAAGGQHSIRVNRQWRICFHWADAGPEDVEIVDYH